MSRNIETRIKEVIDNYIVAYGVLALATLQESGNKDFKLKDLRLEDFENEIKTMIKVYPKEIVLQKYLDLGKYSANSKHKQAKTLQ